MNGLFGRLKGQFKQDIEQIARMLDRGMSLENPEVIEKIEAAAENYNKSYEEIAGAAHHQWGRWVTSREAAQRRLEAKALEDEWRATRNKGETLGDWRERMGK